MSRRRRQLRISSRRVRAHAKDWNWRRRRAWEIVEALIRQNFDALPKGVWIYDLPLRQTQPELGF